MDHSSTVYLMGPDGKFLANYDQTMDPDALAAALKAYL
jgi:cytochrome oxidase Cu insertion factor (SCO1/SenC/PrrC family)